MIDTVIDVEFDVRFVLKIDVAIHLGKDAVFHLEFNVKIDPAVNDAIDFTIDREFELMIDRAEVGGGAISASSLHFAHAESYKRMRK